MLRGRCATVFLLSLFVLPGCVSIVYASTGPVTPVATPSNTGNTIQNLIEKSSKGSDAADITCPDPTKNEEYDSKRPYNATRKVALSASQNIIVRNIYGKPCSDIRNDVEVVQGKCVAAHKCEATECYGTTCKTPTAGGGSQAGGSTGGNTNADPYKGLDPAKIPASDLNKINNPVYQANPMGNTIERAFSGEGFQAPEIQNELFQMNQSINPDFYQPLQQIPDAVYTNLTQPGITHDFGTVGSLSAPPVSAPPANIGSLQGSEFPASPAPTGQSLGSPTGVTGFNSPQGVPPVTAPAVPSSPISSFLSQTPTAPAQDPWSSASIKNLGDLGAQTAQPQVPTDAFGLNPSYTAVNTDWSNAQPVEYPFLSGAKIADQGVGTAGPDSLSAILGTAEPNNATGLIQTPGDLATSPTPVTFGQGTTIQDTVPIPVSAFSGKWATEAAGLGSVWSGNIGELTGNYTNVGSAYDYSQNKYFSFDPTGQQLLAQNETYQQSAPDIIASANQEPAPQPEGPVSVDPGTSPAAPNTFGTGEDLSAKSNPNPSFNGDQTQTDNRPEPQSTQDMRGSIYYPGCVDGPAGCSIAQEGGLIGSRNNTIDPNLTVAAGYDSGLKYGDVVKITNSQTGDATYAVVGDVCPACGKGIDMTPGVANAAGLTQERGVGTFSVGVVEHGMSYNDGLQYASNVNSQPSGGSYAAANGGSVVDASGGGSPPVQTQGTDITAPIANNGIDTRQLLAAGENPPAQNPRFAENAQGLPNTNWEPSGFTYAQTPTLPTVSMPAGEWKPLDTQVAAWPESIPNTQVATNPSSEGNSGFSYPQTLNLPTANVTASEWGSLPDNSTEKWPDVKFGSATVADIVPQQPTVALNAGELNVATNIPAPGEQAPVDLNPSASETAVPVVPVQSAALPLSEQQIAAQIPQTNPAAVDLNPTASETAVPVTPVLSADLPPAQVDVKQLLAENSGALTFDDTTGKWSSRPSDVFNTPQGQLPQDYNVLPSDKFASADYNITDGNMFMSKSALPSYQRDNIPSEYWPSTGDGTALANKLNEGELNAQVAQTEPVPVVPVQSAELPSLNPQVASNEPQTGTPGIPNIPTTPTDLTEPQTGTPGVPNIPTTSSTITEPQTGTPGIPNIPTSQATLPITANVPLPVAAPYPKQGVDSGYQGGSVKDYFESVGQDSSYAFRKQVAISYGIDGFRGTGAQNTQLLRLLRGY